MKYNGFGNGFVEEILSTELHELDFETSNAKKYVITGGPCCGKTTLTEGLKQRGYAVLPEMARILIDHQVGCSGSLVPWEDRYGFQKAVIVGQALIEQSIPDHKIAILDRAMPDNLAYFAYDKTPLTPEMEKIFKAFSSYEHVFIPDRLPMVNDYARKETDKEADALHGVIKGVYSSLGNEVTAIPVTENGENRIEYLSNLIEGLQKR